MFIGQFKHNIDAKGRLIIPSKFRDQCGEKVVVTLHLNKTLALYTMDGWEKYYNKIMSLPQLKKNTRGFVLTVTSSADDLTFDKLGRINLSANLIGKAELNKEVMIIGAGDHIEIWDRQKWDEFFNNNQENFDEMVESLDEYDL